MGNASAKLANPANDYGGTGRGRWSRRPLGRILAQRLSELLGRQVIVENVGGGGGILGSSRVAKAAPDGYQFLYGSVGTNAITSCSTRKPNYNSARNFAPVALITVRHRMSS